MQAILFPNIHLANNKDDGDNDDGDDCDDDDDGDDDDQGRGAAQSVCTFPTSKLFPRSQ